MQKYFDFEAIPVKLTQKDKKILEQINKNARMSLADISRKTGIPKDSVLYRLRRMEREEVFRYAAIINPLKIGLPIANVAYLQLVNFTPEKEKKLVAHIKTNPNIMYGAKLMGKYDFAVGFVARNMLEFDKILNEFKTNFGDIIKDFDIFSIVEEYKYDYLLDLI
jgi:Lrp/AsnC family leucine-responsive transcriptional regulator